MKTFRRVWKYARAYPGLCFATFGSGVLGTLAGLVFPKVTGLVVDNVLIPRHADRLLPYVLLVAGSFLAQAGHAFRTSVTTLVEHIRVA